MTRQLPTVPIAELVTPIETWDPRNSCSRQPFSYIDISSIDRDSKQVQAAASISPLEAPSRARQLVETDDVLVSTVRPNLNAVAQVPAALHGATASTGFCVLRPIPGKLHSRFLFHWVRTSLFIDAMSRRATGASYPAVTDKVVLASKMPLPPLAEQRRIADLLDKADAIRRKRQEALTLTGELVRSAFLDMFGDPVTNPKRWPAAKLETIATFVGGGTPSRARPEYFSGSLCWATSKDMRGEVLLDTQEHITDEAIAGSATKLVPPGAILIVVKSKILLHQLPILLTQVQTCFGQDLKAILTDTRIHARYLARHLRVGARSLLSRARGVNTEGLTLDHLRDYRVMVPPEARIQEFVRFELTQQQLRTRLQSAASEADALVNAVVQEAFCGE